MSKELSAETLGNNLQLSECGIKGSSVKPRDEHAVKY
jgi:hypothetical protein